MNPRAALEQTDKLRAVGLRPTRQRLALAMLLFGKEDRHVTAEELYKEVTDAGGTVSLATLSNREGGRRCTKGRDQCRALQHQERVVERIALVGLTEGMRDHARDAAQLQARRRLLARGARAEVSTGHDDVAFARDIVELRVVVGHRRGRHFLFTDIIAIGQLARVDAIRVEVVNG